MSRMAEQWQQECEYRQQQELDEYEEWLADEQAQIEYREWLDKQEAKHGQVRNQTEAGTPF